MSHSFIHPRSVLATVAAFGLLAATTTALVTQAADKKKPKHSIEEIMKAINKGDDNVCKRVAQGKASKEDIAKLVEYYEDLPLNKPPKGDQKSWDEKTAALVKAVHALKDGAPDAAAKFKEAVNCKSCHSAHKPD
jgi:hypothetical protein